MWFPASETSPTSGSTASEWLEHRACHTAWVLTNVTHETRGPTTSHAFELCSTFCSQAGTRPTTLPRGERRRRWIYYGGVALVSETRLFGGRGPNTWRSTASSEIFGLHESWRREGTFRHSVRNSIGFKRFPRSTEYDDGPRGHVPGARFQHPSDLIQFRHSLVKHEHTFCGYLAE